MQLFGVKSDDTTGAGLDVIFPNCEWQAGLQNEITEVTKLVSYWNFVTF